MNNIHDVSKREFPPFDGLVAFEAAARHRSMTLAAGELGLTQSAVSHRLRKLEDFIGAPLFSRGATGLAPTSAGVSLLAKISELLDDMAGLRARFRATARPSSLRVGVGAALSHYWLARRLPGFMKSHPDIGLDLVVVETEAQMRAADVDVMILWLPASLARASSTQRLLFRERVFPVVAPRYLRRGRPLSDPQRLRDLPLIHKGQAGRNDGAEWSWPVWFERLRIDGAVPEGVRFSSLSLALASALEGGGAVLARSLLVQDALSERRLCRLLAPQWDMPSSKAHLLRWRPALSGDKRVKRFANWLAAEAELSCGPDSRASSFHAAARDRPPRRPFPA